MKNIEERKGRWCDFYSGQIRTVIMIEMKYDGPQDSSPQNGGSQEDIKFNSILGKYRMQRDCLEWLDDDRIPCISIPSGTDSFARAFGAPVKLVENASPFAKPIIFSAADVAKFKKPKLEDTSLMEYIEQGIKLKKAAPEALLQLTDIQSPFGIAALLWEKAGFFMALLDEPEAVKDLVSVSAELLTEFIDLWFKTFGTEFIAHYPDYYMPSGITLSEDEIGSISPEQFAEFAIPELNKLTQRYGGRIGIHCCATAKHQWPLFKTIPGLVMLNLNQPNEITREASTFFKDGLCQIEPYQIHCYDFGARVVLQGYAETKETALAKLSELEELSKKFT